MPRAADTIQLMLGSLDKIVRRKVSFDLLVQVPLEERRQITLRMVEDHDGQVRGNAASALWRWLDQETFDCDPAGNTEMLHTLLHSEHETIVDRAASRIHWITFKWPPAIIDRLLELLSVSDWRHASSAAASALARHHADDPKMLGRVLDYAEEEPMMALDALHQFRASTFSDEHISQLIAIVPEMRAVMHSNYDYGTLMRHIGPRVIPHVHRRLDTASADEHQTLKQISTMFESM